MRAPSVGGTVDRRLLDDRVSLFVSASRWFPSDARAFAAGSLGATFRSSREPSGWVVEAQTGVDAADAHAPLALWSGAGTGRARPRLLRAHPLLDGGIIDGAVFGATVRYATAEAQRWLARPSLVRLAIAGFVDAASASRGEVDAGVGVRLRVPGRDGVLRVDYARGLRDGANALTVGWMVSALPGSSPTR
jgi:hypothetical protein